MGNYYIYGAKYSDISNGEFIPKKKDWEIPWENNNPREYCLKTGAPCIYCTYSDCENRTSERPTIFKKSIN